MEKCDFHVDVVDPLVGDADVVVVEGFDIASAFTWEFTVTEISDAF